MPTPLLWPTGCYREATLGVRLREETKKKTGRKKDYSHNLQLAEGPLFLVFWPE